jgi:hypothetical protein
MGDSFAAIASADANSTVRARSLAIAVWKSLEIVVSYCGGSAGYFRHRFVLYPQNQPL